VRQSAAPARTSEASAYEPSLAPPSPLEAPAEPAEDEGHGEAPINENRAGHLPTLGEIGSAIETPAAPTSLIGRYSAGGANYMIFNDGSIEAETKEGTYKFASMIEFKRYLADKRSAKG